MSFRSAATSLKPLIPTRTPIFSHPSALTPRSTLTKPTTVLRHASSAASTSSSHASSSSSSISGVKAGSLALVGLVAWSSVFFYVGQQGKKTDHGVKHEVEVKVKQVKKDVQDKAKQVGAKASEVKDKVGEKVDHVKEKVEAKVDEAKQALPTSTDPDSDRPDPDDPSSPQSAAYDPETGEINWDCPCLGGMADGPCGPEFKLAFSCFVYSEAEPKGVDCVEKFRGMQECFRQHPDIYGTVDEDDDTFELVSAAQEALDLPEDEDVKL
ncbi:BQ5605_C033g11169 [Microbotryum silenes-dioicae]|uniref:Mitochondrial intermembrane space import and assembly protein 40 n=1 Tax=Microbotryum silenes-dioicae TaxID=796604 RepID=A0A2X0N304_9BASI|nr:BQ5605_C033g11169 [Microbotryum silenes-dioicae]